MKQILLQPVITEKSMRDAAHSVFTFLVDPGSGKHVVAAAVESAFKVHVIGLRSATTKGGGRRVGRLRRLLQDQPKKIVRVQLKEGEKIALFESKKD